MIVLHAGKVAVKYAGRISPKKKSCLVTSGTRQAISKQREAIWSYQAQESVLSEIS